MVDMTNKFKMEEGYKTIDQIFATLQKMFKTVKEAEEPLTNDFLFENVSIHFGLFKTKENAPVESILRTMAYLFEDKNIEPVEMITGFNEGGEWGIFVKTKEIENAAS